MMDEKTHDVDVVPSTESSQSSNSMEKAPNEAVDQEMLDALEEPNEIRRIVREAILLAGGAVAILLQVAEPGVGKGVDNYSNFSYRPMDRLRTTMTYVYCMAFGSRQEKEAIVELVHRAHAPVKGKDYDADDPELQLWVAATLYAVGTDLYQRVFGPISEAMAEEIYREYAVLAVSLRVKPGMWPPSRRAFWEYWDHKIETIEVTDHARRVAKDLLWNKKLPIYFRPLLPLVRISTTEMLTPRLQKEFGLKSTKGRKRAFGVMLGLTKATYPALPKVVRTYPMRYYLKDMRRRLKNMDVPIKGH